MPDLLLCRSSFSNDVGWPLLQVMSVDHVERVLFSLSLIDFWVVFLTSGCLLVPSNF
jgi:hypothetical protein